MKKLINDPIRVVPEMLEGLVALNPDLALLSEELVVVRSDVKSWRQRGHVALISGGGSGHEPAHAGYVGEGMLTGAVCGEVFTSPSTDAVLAAIRACASPAGVLLIVKNYTGDRLNFGLAAEIARSEGIPTDMIVVRDDVSLRVDAANDQSRGLAGTVFVHKVAGAAAAAGRDLAGVKEEAEQAAAALGTMGIALSSCTIPAAGRPTFELGDTEVEFGLGIHGERGVRRATIAAADALVAELIETIAGRLTLVDGDRVALLVNNLGGTPQMELAIVARRASQLLESRGIRVERGWCGTFLTALEMSGCSISVMRTDATRLARLDAVTRAPAWVRVPARTASRPVETLDAPAPAPPPVAPGSPAYTDPVFGAALTAVADKLLAEEATLTALDQAVGDGDLGLSMSRAARAIQDLRPALTTTPPAAALRLLAASVRRVVGGSSGPFYSIALLRAGMTLDQGDSTVAGWAAALDAACRAISELGGATRGDRTMLDALYPASDALRAAAGRGMGPGDALSSMAAAAEQGAQATADMPPKRGRSTYLGDRALGHPDPGAIAVAMWMRALADSVTGR